MRIVSQNREGRNYTSNRVITVQIKQHKDLGDYVPQRANETQRDAAVRLDRAVYARPEDLQRFIEAKTHNL